MVRALDALGALGPFDSLRPLDALVSLHTRNPLGTIVAAIDAAVFAAVFTTVGALLSLGAQHDPEAIVVLAQSHALEVELAGELLNGLGDLQALLRRQVALADAHVARAAVEQRADLGDELLDIDRAGGIARDNEPSLFALIFALILASVFAPIFSTVLLPHVGGLRYRHDRLHQRCSQSHRCDGLDASVARRTR